MKMDRRDFDKACGAVLRQAMSRKPRARPTLIALILCIAIPAPAVSATAYVTDQHGFNLRAGEGTRYRIISELKSGTALDVVSENQRTGYSKVRLSDGTEGYILSRYLQQEPTAALKLRKATARLTQLEQSPSALALMLDQTRTELAELKRKNKSNLAELVAAKAELKAIRAASKDTVGLMNEHKTLARRVNYLEQLTSQLQQVHAALLSDRRHRWMALGAGVFSIGVLLGAILPRVLPRSNSTTR
jgi:SH3 domain protein